MMRNINVFIFSGTPFKNVNYLNSVKRVQYGAFVLKVSVSSRAGNKKVKLTLCLTKPLVMKTYWGSGGTAPCHSYPRHLMVVSGQLQASAALLPGKEHPVPI